MSSRPLGGQTSVFLYHRLMPYDVEEFMFHRPLIQRAICLGLIIFLLTGCIGSAPQNKSSSTEEWQTSTPEEQDMSSEKLSGLQRHIMDELPHIRSVLIVRNAYLVFEYYRNPFNETSRHALFSVTKSFTSALIGIALEEGYIEYVDQKMIDFFPENVTSDTAPENREITIEHLLTMTAGFPENPMMPTLTVKEKVGQMLLSPPGDAFRYDSGSSHLLSAILTESTNKNALQFGKEHLFEPLGISNVKWPRDYAGYNFGSHGLSLRSRDMAKFGYLYLNQGVWNGEQVVPQEWVNVSTRKHNDGGPPIGEQYGYQFWITTVNEHSAYFAAGYGGQFIYVLPDLRIVVVITSNYDLDHGENREIIGEFVVPSVFK
jgi:CubicO group peptidase (beta-lactamase class C family)